MYHLYLLPLVDFLVAWLCSSKKTRHKDKRKSFASPMNPGARLPIPVFRNPFFGPPKPVPARIPEDSFFSCFFFFRRNFFTGTWFWRGLENSCFQPLSQEFFPGIPAGQKFLYLHRIPLDSSGFLRIPPDSSGFLRIPVPAKSCLN